MIDIQLPDGRTVTIETDDPTAAVAAGRKIWETEGSAAAPKQVEPAFRPQVGWQGSGRGLAETVGFLPDLAAGAMRLGSEGVDKLSTSLGGPELNLYEPKMLPSEAISWLSGKAANAFGLDTVNPESMTDAERLVYETNRFAAQAGLGSSGLIKAAEKNVVPFLSRPYRNAGATTVVGDTAAGGGAGTALATYEQNAPDWVKEHPAIDPIARIFSMLAGGAGGAGVKGLAEGTGNLALRTGKKLTGRDKVKELGRDPATGDFYRAPDADEAARIVQAAASNPSIAAANLRDNISDLSPFSTVLPTTGLLSDDVGLVGAEKALRSSFSTPFIERDQMVNTNARQLLDETMPRGSTGRDFTETDLKPAVTAMRGERSAEYRAGMQPLEQNKTVLNFAPIEQAIDRSLGIQKFKGISLDNKTNATQGQIKSVVDEWKALDPAEYHTVSGLDALKQKIGNILESTQPGTPEHKAASGVFNAVRDEIAKQSPDYTGVMRKYGAASRKIEQTEDALKAVADKSPAKAATAIFGSKDSEKTAERLVAAIGADTKARDGLKAAVLEHLVASKTMHAPHKTTTGQNPVSFAQLDDLILKHERTLAKIFSPGEMNNLQGIHRLIRRFKDREMQATTGSQTAERMQGSEFLDTIELIVKLPPGMGGWGQLAGGGIMRSIRLALRRSGIDPTKDREAVSALSRRFFFEPEIAEHLLTRKLPGDEKKWVARLNAMLGLAEAGRESIPAD